MATVNMWNRISPRRVNLWQLYRQFRVRTSGQLCATYSTTAPSLNESEPAKYPPVKPRWPPGKWGPPITEEVAWSVHDKGTELLQIPNVKERLENIAGEKAIFMYKLDALDFYPSILDYKQYITKTHFTQGLPDVYKNIHMVENRITDLEGIIETVLNQEFSYQQHLSNTETECNRHRIIGQILNCVRGSLAYEHPHLLRSQFDESVRVESFWWRAGFVDGPEKPMRYTSGTSSQGQGGMVRLQGLHQMNYQIRTEMPLPEFVPVDDKLCTEGEVPTFDHAPMCAGQKRIFERPITMSGHWVGDPCEFGQLGVTVLSGPDEDRLWQLSQQQKEEKMVEFGLVTGFLSCLAQAHNQGFNVYHDVTYPFTTQTLVTNGQWFQFFAYQLNTLQVWKPDDVHSLRNVCWASDRMKLYDLGDNGEATNINPDVLHHLVQSLVLEPKDRGSINMRPHLPEEEAPVNKRLYINHVGEQLLDIPVIGRHQYPANAVYF